MKLIDWFKLYSDLNFHLFPVIKHSKRPAIRDNLNAASADVKVLLDWNRKFKNPNWGLSLAKSGKVAVDIDIKYSGLDKWNRLVETYGEPKTLKARTPSGGLHLVFNAKSGSAYRGKIERGIDVKHNGYIVVEPSAFDKGAYRWQSNIRKPANIYPSWLGELIEKPSLEKSTLVEKRKIELEELKQLITKIQSCDLDYEEWVAVGMAIKSVFPNEDGLNLYLLATQNESFQSGDLEKAKAKWQTFSDHGGVGLGTLIHILKEKGVSLEEFFKSQILKDFDVIGTGQARPEQSQLIFDSKDALVQYVNKMNVFFLEEGQGEFIGQLTHLHSGEPRVCFHSPQKFQTLLAPYKLRERHGDKVKYFDAHKVWASSLQRKTYKNIRFAPACAPNEINLWHTPKLTSIPGNCSAILKVIEQSLCNSNKETCAWLLNWLAHIVQKPAEKVFTVPVFISTEGTGKGLLMDGFMRKILGSLFTKVSGTQELTDRFNTHLMSRWLTFIDEATWDPSQRAASVLKSLTGSPTMYIEQKFGARFEVENFSRYAIATNNEDAIAVSIDSRRFFVIEVSEKYANQHDFFEEARIQLYSGPLANHFYNLLLTRDLAGFNPNQFPRNKDTGLAAKLRSEGVVAQFWHQTFFDQATGLFYEGKGLSARHAFDAFNDFQMLKRSSLSPSEFWIRCKALIPPLKTCKTIEVRRSSQKTRAYPVEPRLLMTAFCDRMKVSPPEQFDPKSFYIEEST